MVRQRLVYPIVILALIGAVWLNNSRGIAARAHEGVIAHDALCAFQEGLQQDIINNRRKRDDQKEYLRMHPNGAPAIGVSASDIRTAIATTQSTIDAQKRRVRQLKEAGLEC